MAKITITAGYLSLGGVDYSAQVSELGLDFQVEDKDVTNMSSAGFKEYIGGLKGGSITAKFVRDADFSGLDAAMETALGTLIAFEIRFNSAVVGATNPKWTGNVLVKDWSPFKGQVGATHENSITWPISGAWTRAIA